MAPGVAVERPAYWLAAIYGGGCAAVALAGRPVPPVMYICAGVSVAVLAFAAAYLAVVDPSRLRSRRFDV